MLKVAIVDDELDVRERLTSILSKIDSGFELTASYENGIDAYNGIVNNPPDLLITDIRIPYINGIELIRRIREVEPFMKVIIITGYDEVDYAKQAIELEVIGFITKPTSSEELSRILKKAKLRIDQEFMLNSSLSELTAFKQQNLSVIRENDLCKLVSFRILSPGFQNKLLNEGVNLNYEYMMIGVFDFDKNIEDLEMELSQMSLLSIKQNMEKEFQKFYDYEIFNRDNQLIIILKSHKGFTYAEIDKYISYELLRVKRFLRIHLSIGFSEISYGNHDFKQLFLNAKKALEMRKVIGEGKVFFYDSIKEMSSSNKTIDDSEYKHLAYLVKYRSIDEVNDYLNHLKSILIDPEYHSSYYFMVSNILNTLLQSCDDLRTLYKEYLDCNQIYLKMSNFKTVDETFNWFCELAEMVKKIDDDIIVGAIDHNLQKIIDYIEAHFTTEDINLDIVSEKVNLSSSYISSLLKKQFNLSFVKYVTMLRMEKARELLNNSQLKIIDVSEKTGYSEPYYFSHCFKKYYGVSPKEYRTNEKN